MAEIKIHGDKAQRWRERIVGQVSSGKTIRSYCEDEQIHWQAFYYCRKKLRGLPGQALKVAKSQSQFISLPRKMDSVTTRTAP